MATAELFVTPNRFYPYPTVVLQIPSVDDMANDTCMSTTIWGWKKESHQSVPGMTEKNAVSHKLPKLFTLSVQQAANPPYPVANIMHGVHSSAKLTLI